MRVAGERRVRVVDAPVQSQARLIAEQRTGCDAAQVGEIRRRQIAIDYASLFVTLPVSEEENAILANGTSQGETELPPLKERVGIGGVAAQTGVGGQVVVAKEIESRAVKMIISGARHHVDCPGIGNAG